MCQTLETHQKTLKKKHLIIIISEGAKDEEGNQITSNHVKDTIENKLKYETRVYSILNNKDHHTRPSPKRRISVEF
jgi:6-phosphofructokinase